MFRNAVIAGAIAISLTTAGPVGAEDQSKQGDPMLKIMLVQGFMTGMLPHIAKIGQNHNIPAEVVDKFVQCFAEVMVGYVDTSDPSLWNLTLETRAKVSQQMLGGLAPSLANGGDPLGEACPREAQAYRSYL